MHSPRSHSTLIRPDSVEVMSCRHDVTVVDVYWPPPCLHHCTWHFHNFFYLHHRLHRRYSAHFYLPFFALLLIIAVSHSYNCISTAAAAELKPINDRLTQICSSLMHRWYRLRSNNNTRIVVCYAEFRRPLNDGQILFYRLWCQIY